jgi:hypothetical protein
MLIPFGILSASAVGSDYELIESSILGSSTSAITFSSLGTYASIYKHLQIRMSYGSNTGANGTYTRMRLNGDSGTNYARHALEGRGATGVFSTASTSQNSINIGPSSGTQNSLHSEAHIMDFVDSFSTSKNKTIRSFGGMTSTGYGILLMSGLWVSTSSVTSIELQAMSQGATSTYGSGSRFSLYGIKG